MEHYLKTMLPFLFSSSSLIPKLSNLSLQPLTNLLSMAPFVGDNETKIKEEMKKQRLKFQPTKYPVVLCHGLFGFDKIGPDFIPALQLSYWRGVYDVLNQNKCKVYIARVNPVGNIQQRAQQLDQFLRENLQGQDINLIAHSMGGLDSRFLISHLKSNQYNVRSLTTISTPHRGSPFMDWIRDLLGVGALPQDLTKSEHTILHKIMSPFDAPAYSNLTTDYLTQQFNPSTPNDENVKYYSYGACIENVSLFSPLRIPWEIVKQQEGENDGFVSVHSSRWGEYIQTIYADHFELKKVKKISSNTKEQSVKFTLPSFMHLNFFPLPSFIQLQFLQNLFHKTQSENGKKKQVVTPYTKRVEHILNHMYGPKSFDDYIYGYDDEMFRPKKSPSSFHNEHFHMKIITRLAKEGF